jgi:hypothetical protein
MKKFLVSVIVVFTGAWCLPSMSGASPASSGLPRHAQTPGAINPAVTQGTISSTICVSGYTRTIRPPSSYTTGLKRQQLAAGYNLNGDLSTYDYEEDHLVPLEVGGNPTSVKNLWPEPRHILWSAAKKDRLENTIHSLICSGALSLRAGQRIFETNWEAGYQKYIGSPTQ